MSKVILTTEEELEALIRKVLLELIPPPSSSDNNEKLSILTVDEAAKFLSLARQTLYGMTCKSEIPYYKVGKRLYFKQQELMDWINKHRKPTIKERVEEYENSRTQKKRY